MSLKPELIPPVPESTKRIAQAAFPKGNIYLRMRDELGTLYTDEQFTSLFPACGQPAESPWRLALVCIMQYAENLSDRQAADAVRGRIDWKYAKSNRRLRLTARNDRINPLAPSRKGELPGASLGLRLSV